MLEYHQFYHYAFISRNKTETNMTRNTFLFLYLFPLVSFQSVAFILQYWWKNKCSPTAHCWYLAIILDDELSSDLSVWIVFVFTRKNIIFQVIGIESIFCSQKKKDCLYHFTITYPCFKDCKSTLFSIFIQTYIQFTLG